jgi:VIT1/CCC1 family predicted Fe2+/Mn2+ transporter
MAGSTLGDVFRTLLAAVLLVLLLPALVIANASEWAARTVVDDQAFTTTATRVMETPALRTVVADRISGQVVEALLSNPITARVVATEILGLGADATAPEIETGIRSRLAVALDDPAVRRTRDAIIEDIHAYLIGAATGASGAVRIQGDALILDSGPLIDRLATAVDARLAPGTITIPLADRTIVLVESEALETTSTALTWLDLGRFLIPIAAVIVALAIVGLAHRRVRALGLVGLAVTLAGLVTLVVAWVGGEAIGTATSDPTVRQVATEVYSAFLSLLVLQSVLLIVVGLLIALIAWAIQRRRQSSRRSTTVAMP